MRYGSYDTHARSRETSTGCLTIVTIRDCICRPPLLESLRSIISRTVLPGAPTSMSAILAVGEYAKERVAKASRGEDEGWGKVDQGHLLG